MPKEQGNEQKDKPKDVNDVELVFGSSNNTKTVVVPDVHVVNERRHMREPSTVISRGGDSDVEAVPQTQPLLEPDRGRQKPPLAGPEVDDLDEEEAKPTAPYPGIDDGLLDTGTGDHKLDGEDVGPDHKQPNGHPVEDGVGTDDGNWWRSADQPDYPYDPNILTRFGPDDRPGSPMIPGTIIPDVNTYQQKKNLAQGMMDLALLSANANQLRYVLESSARHPYYYPSLVFISLSILFQVAVGVGLIMNSRYDVKDDKEMCRADKINNMTVLGIFLITIVNVFITSFSVATPSVTGA